MKLLNFDPLREEKYSPLPGLIHKYSNRVLVMITSRCAEYCCFCTRKRIKNADFEITEKQILAIKKYLLKNHKIKEVIFSGGDPLMAPGTFLRALNILGKVKSIKIIRVHTRLPISSGRLLSRKILSAFAAERSKPIYLCLHVNRLNEINPEAIATIECLRKTGIILLSQTVFIRGFNDSVSILEKLFSRLIELGVKPYYIFHCDPVRGNEKYIVGINKEIEIMSQLRRRLSGLAFPLHTVDAPGGSGKVPAPTDFWTKDRRHFRDFRGNKIEIY